MMTNVGNQGTIFCRNESELKFEKQRERISQAKFRREQCSMKRDSKCKNPDIERVVRG